MSFQLPVLPHLRRLVILRPGAAKRGAAAAIAAATKTVNACQHSSSSTPAAPISLVKRSGRRTARVVMRKSVAVETTVTRLEGDTVAVEGGLNVSAGRDYEAM